MNKETVIAVEHLTKDFVLHGNETLFSRIAARLHGKEGPRKIHALDNVSFAVHKGEVLGVIGKNGSGKSTLLRILGGIYPPTSGKVQVSGKVVPLINLQVGLQPKLTMRDNIYLVGSIFGMSREDVYKKFDSIVEFSELSGFVNTQIFQFSSGMLGRLAFSIAVHLEPEVLLLDEVFTAGDMGFQKKSRARMMELVRGDTTVVIASHSEDLITKVADRAIWLEGGCVRAEGLPGEVIKAYHGCHGGLPHAPQKGSKKHIKSKVSQEMEVDFIDHSKDPLFVFFHLLKTGGTTIRQHVLRSMRQGEVLAAYHVLLNGKDPNAFLASLSEKEKNGVRVIFGHSLLLKEVPTFFDEREVRFITFMRDPADRVISIYNHHRREYDRTGRPGDYSNILSENGDILSFEEWLDIMKHRMIMNPVNNLIRRSFPMQGVSINVNSTHLETAKQILKGFTFVGIMEQPEDFSICYSLMGVQASHARRENVAIRSYIDLTGSKFKDMNELKEYINFSLPYAKDFYEYAKDLNKRQKQELKTKPIKSLTQT